MKLVSAFAIDLPFSDRDSRDCQDRSRVLSRTLSEIFHVIPVEASVGVSTMTPLTECFKAQGVGIPDHDYMRRKSASELAGILEEQERNDSGVFDWEDIARPDFSQWTDPSLGWTRDVLTIN